MHLNVIKTTLKTIFLQKSRFFHYNQRNYGLKDNFSKTPLKIFGINCTYLGRIHFKIFSAWCEKRMTLKSDQLEILINVFTLKEANKMCIKSDFDVTFS